MTTTAFRLLPMLLAALAAAGEPTSPAGLLAPVAAEISGAQASTGAMVIDGSGLVDGGGGRFVHSADRWTDGGCMWVSGPVLPAWIRLDLGRTCTVVGLWVWNVNEKGYTRRGARRADVLASIDGVAWTPAGAITLRQASGTAEEAGEYVALAAPVQARHLELRVTATHGERWTGLSELRVHVGDQQPGDRTLASRPPFVARYPRTTPRSEPGGPIVYPADAGVVDVTRPPYNAIPDGRSDCTAAIQRALDDHPASGTVIWLPAGVYRISDTLRWSKGPRGGQEQKNTILRGQGRQATVLALADATAGFTDPRQPKPVIWTGGPPAQRFANEIADLTLDTGAGNPGCIGIAFTANNQGAVRDVRIISGDGQGVRGLDLTTAENGPLLLKRVTVQGFEVGIACAGGINSQTMERITLRHQLVAGLRNAGQPLSVRGLTSDNEVPAVVHRTGLLVLLDAVCTGSGAAASIAAVEGDGAMLVRGLRTTGYARAIARKEAPTTPDVERFVGGTPVALIGAASAVGLELEARDAPEPAWDPPEEWISPLAFGGRPDDGGDDTAALQQAIDAGRRTVYLPRGTWTLKGTVFVRGAVARVVGCRARLDHPAQEEPVFQVADGSAPAVAFEHLSAGYTTTPTFANASARAVVVRHCLNVCGSFGRGPVFLEDVCSNPQRGWEFRGTDLWARQFNVENQGTHVRIAGGRAWILGLKTERGGTLVHASDDAAVELLGGFSYTTSAGGLAPMFLVEDARFAATFTEVCFNRDPFTTIVRERRGATTSELAQGDARWRRTFTLFTAGVVR